jgi:hypothetical protein
MRYALGLAVGLMLPITAFAQSTPITGTWSLVSLTEDHHGQFSHPLGDKPQGQIIYGEHGETAVVLVSSEREKKPGNPLNPVGPSIGYFGSYTVSGNNLSLHIVASTFPNFGGTDQKGTVTVKGDSLTLVREILSGAEPFTSTLELTRMK